MKATGVVRRIDDLGRVVIPKEIRKTLRIKEGDPLDIYRQRRASYFKKVFTNRRTFRVCSRICRNFVKDDRTYCLYYG